MPKRLPIDLDDVCIGLETSPDDDMRWYLDAQTGATILVTQEYDPAADGPTLDDLEALPERYLAIPRADPDQGYRDMKEFAAGLPDAQLRESLEIALAGNGPFRRFRNVLAHVPEQRERWFAFKRQRTGERARGWLTEVGLEATAHPSR